MAWDAEEERLNGVLDFGDAGMGPFHAELVQPSLPSFDLVRRLGRTLGALKGREVDERRAFLLAARHRLEELAEDGGAFAPAMAAEGVRAAEAAGFLAIPRGRS